MSPVGGGKRLELVCILCNEALADLERACAGQSLNNGNKNEDASEKNTIGEGTVSETNTTVADSGKFAASNVGGYYPLTNECQKDVVATKCGHMFHQGCLRKYVHKTLIEGKGGSLFCPICTRPFAMNRLWPVIIPATKMQRERFLQLKMMKEQNADMVKQLKEIRAKISEEEGLLRKIKEDSEECLQDIQQKQKLLDSVNGPTNKEMIELTKMHMKRQEILHVVTQHNADLLKLLAEESNISTSTAEKMIGVKTGRQTNQNSNGDAKENAEYKNQVILMQSASPQCLSSIFPQLIPDDGKSSKKGKVKKSHQKSKKKGKKKNKLWMPELGRVVGESEMSLNLPQTHDENQKAPRRNPSDAIPQDPNVEAMMKKFPGVLNPGCRTVDTFIKWNAESVKELMSLDSLPEANSEKIMPTQNCNVNDGGYQPPTGYQNKKGVPLEVQSGRSSSIFPSHHPQKDSVSVVLARKAPVIMHKNVYHGLVKK